MKKPLIKTLNHQSLIMPSLDGWKNFLFVKPELVTSLFDFFPPCFLAEERSSSPYYSFSPYNIWYACSFKGKIITLSESLVEHVFNIGFWWEYYKIPYSLRIFIPEDIDSVCLRQYLISMVGIQRRLGRITDTIEQHPYSSF